MMISPELYVEELKNKSYKDLLQQRDDLLEKIYTFENGRIEEKEFMMKPSPDVKYQMNLEYLGELCKLIAEKYRRIYME